MPRHTLLPSSRMRSAIRLKRLIVPMHLFDTRPRFVEDLCEELRLVDGVRCLPLGDDRTNAAFTRQPPDLSLHHSHLSATYVRGDATSGPRSWKHFEVAAVCSLRRSGQMLKLSIG